MFNILIKSDINTITKLYQESDVVVKICNDKYFWEKKFEHDNLAILKYRIDIGGWYD